ncbi:MAG: sensor histidine kinase [Actinomycetales bacterium]
MPPTRRAPSWLLDAGLAVPLLVIGLGGTGPAAHAHPGAPRAIDHVAYLLVVIAAGSLLLRGTAPWVALGLDTAAVATFVGAGYAYGPILLTVPAMAFGLGLAWPRLRAGLAVGGGLLVIAGATVVRGVYQEDSVAWTDLLSGWLVWLLVVAALCAIGASARVRRESTAGVRAEQARRAASEEQLRMAQELHDVVGHGLAVIAMQAGVALHVLDREPEKVRESLEAIQSMSRESLEGLRTELAQLRAGSGDAPQRRPVPGLADVEVLVQRIRNGGVDVRLDAPPIGDIPTEVAAAAYRIVQESLTNVLRHAGADRATVTLRAEGEALVVEVEDTGRGSLVSASDPHGNGISGMRERAEALGGHLEAGPRTTGGFRVHAVLPFTAQVPERIG